LILVKVVEEPKVIALDIRIWLRECVSLEKRPYTIARIDRPSTHEDPVGLVKAYEAGRLVGLVLSHSPDLDAIMIHAGDFIDGKGGGLGVTATPVVVEMGLDRGFVVGHVYHV
jgi:hypothetical protein